MTGLHALSAEQIRTILLFDELVRKPGGRERKN